MFGRSSSKSGTKNTGKKQHKTLQDMQESSLEQNLSKLENDMVDVITNAETGQNGFFCMDEPFVTRFDDNEMLKYVQCFIPDFVINPGCA